MNKKTLVLLVPIWFLIIFGLSLAGVFQSGSGLPIALGLSIALPWAAFAFLISTSARFRDTIRSMNPRLLTALQGWRSMGVVFLILYARHLLPAQFALPAGCGDVLIGLTALPVAWAMSKNRLPRVAFFAWHSLGMADLIIAVSMGILSSPTPLGLLRGEISSAVVADFPTSLIPTFFVPLVMILHWMALASYRHQLRGLAQ